MEGRKSLVLMYIDTYIIKVKYSLTTREQTFILVSDCLTIFKFRLENLRFQLKYIIHCLLMNWVFVIEDSFDANKYNLLKKTYS